MHLAAACCLPESGSACFCLPNSELLCFATMRRPKMWRELQFMAGISSICWFWRERLTGVSATCKCDFSHHCHVFIWREHRLNGGNLRNFGGNVIIVWRERHISMAGTFRNVAGTSVMWRELEFQILAASQNNVSLAAGGRHQHTISFNPPLRLHLHSTIKLPATASRLRHHCPAIASSPSPIKHFTS